MCMGDLPVFVCASHACSAHRGQKRLLDLLEVELQMVVSPHVGAGNSGPLEERSYPLSDPASPSRVF